MSILSETLIDLLKAEDENQKITLSQIQETETYHLFNCKESNGKCKLDELPRCGRPYSPKKQETPGPCKKKPAIRIQVAELANEGNIEICGTCVATLYKND